MKDPDIKFLSDSVWFDRKALSVLVGYERFSLSFSLEEFFDFADQLEIARQELLKDKTLNVTTYIDKDGKSKIILLVNDNDVN